MHGSNETEFSADKQKREWLVTQTAKQRKICNRYDSFSTMNTSLINKERVDLVQNSCPDEKYEHKIKTLET